MSDNIIKNSTSCMDEFDPKSLLVDQALDNILTSITPVKESENIDVKNSLNRILANDIHSPVDIPPYTNSAMDGYAINADDLPTKGTITFEVTAKVMAGTPTDITIGKNQAARIMTGGKMPAGTDTVIMQEHVNLMGDVIEIGTEHKARQNVRLAGEDIKTGQCVLNRGKRLSTADIGLIASLGIASIDAYRKPIVAFFSTGDELVPLGQPLEDGQIYDSNRYSLHALLTQFGADIIDLGAIKDDPVSIEGAFIQASNEADVLITTGGVSVGEADYVKATLDKLGIVDFWKIAMKPGRPLAYGKVNKCLFFGLPGNPVSTMVTFLQFVLPGLRKLQNEPVVSPLQIKLRCVTPLKKRSGRVEFQRGIMELDKNGEYVVRSVSGQGSHMVGSMSQANCFIVLALDSQGVDQDTMVDVQPFSAFL